MPTRFDGNRTFSHKVRNFPESAYRVDDSSTHIYKLLWTLLQDPGLGQLRRWQALARSCETLGGTNFGDLDYFFGEMLQFNRLPTEQYLYSPFTDQLTMDEWNEVTCKDSSYRSRIAMFLQSVLRGGTNEGLAMAAEAASGWPCQVIEMWRVTSGSGVAQTYGRGLSSAKEIVVVPFADALLSMDVQRSMGQILDRLKPVNTIVTIDQGAYLAHTIITLRYAASPSEYFEIRRYISNVSPTKTSYGWLAPNQESLAPTFAFLRSQEDSWSLNESVNKIATFRIESNYRLKLGTLQANIVTAPSPGTQENISITETTAPAAPVFRIRIDDEVMLVLQRVPSSSSAAQFQYTVLRGQDATVTATHTSSHNVNTNYIPFPQIADVGGKSFGPWRQIDTADSKDNFPNGRYTGDPSKYDANGNYIFAWSTQAEYVSWFTRQITNLGGEIQGNQFRLPNSLEVQPGLLTRPEYALAGPELTVQSRFYPEAR